jgi:membrane-associated phospholipid phosphatase
VWIWAQASDSGAVPDSSSDTSSSTSSSTTSDAPAAVAQATPPPADREVSWLTLPRNIVEDQRAIWLAPLKLKERKYWIPTAAVLAATAGLLTLDPIEGHYFRNASLYNGFNNVVSGKNATLAIVIAPLSLYGAGLIGKDSKMKSTALLAGEAVADSEILTTILKDIDRRVRPAGLPPTANFWDTWFEDNTNKLRGNGSFPSGHTIAAFSVATVIARRYGNHKWVPYVAYGGAALIGFSRLTLSAHFASDVFVGGVLGYSISRFTVLGQ